jgi:hypothetical protein
MPTKLLSMADVVRESQVPRYRIVYALQSGAIREPLKINGRRLFSLADLRRIVTHFAKGGQR